MNKYLATALALLATAALAFSTGRRAAPPTPVAVIDVQTLLDGLEQRPALERELQAFIDTRQAQLNEVVEAVRAAQDEVELAREDSPQRRDALRRLREAQNVARFRREAFDREILIERGTIWSTLFKQIDDAVDEVAARDGWQLVIHNDSSLELPVQGRPEPEVIEFILRRKVLYAESAVDITDEVRTVMNNRFNAGG
jgi:Skp family chaperone for outer membrane proteins